MKYYFVPKQAERPVYSYRLSIVHFWLLIGIYMWTYSHHLHYTAQPNWLQSLGVAFFTGFISALGQASVSFTMGTTSHISKSASSAILVSQDLNGIDGSLQQTKKFDLIIKQNLCWALVYNLIAIPFAAMGLIPAWTAAIGVHWLWF